MLSLLSQAMPMESRPDGDELLSQSVSLATVALVVVPVLAHCCDPFPQQSRRLYHSRQCRLLFENTSHGTKGTRCFPATSAMATHTVMYRGTACGTDRTAKKGELWTLLCKPCWGTAI
jgi:hypothetical protein